jgi:metallo-beta-lactamase family protein
MHVTFYGAAREVTGSMHLVGAGANRILLDCGMFQGRRKESNEKNRVLPFDAAMITNMALSHAHIDHSGRIPLLTRNGFIGRVLCTRATADACRYLLPDAAHIQEQDAHYLNYKTVRSALSGGQHIKGAAKGKRRSDGILEKLKKNRHHLNHQLIHEMIARYRLEEVVPLFTTEDAAKSLSQIDGIPYRHPVAIGEDLDLSFYEAGHILGSAITILHYRHRGRCYTVGYTGDLGRFNKPILRDPASVFDSQDRVIDVLIMESTYGDREHEPVEDLKPKLREILKETISRGGSILIPSFAFGRTQELLYIIHELYDEKAVPRIPVWVDSPLAADMTKVFGEHPELYDDETNRTFLRNGKNPFDFEQVHFTSSVDDSMALMRETAPHIVISASGMCEAGRILHHLRYKIHDSRNTILIVGFMAQNTLGRRILEQGSKFQADGRIGAPPLLSILNKVYPLNARVFNLGGFSAHADRKEMLEFLKKSGLKIKKIAVVHGEEEQSVAFSDLLQRSGYNAWVPAAGETMVLE